MSEILQLIALSSFTFGLLILFVVLMYWTSEVAEAFVKWSVRLYRLLLAAYPASFRNEYGEAMVQLFRDTARDAYRRRGLLGLLMVWPRTLTDLAVSVVRQHRDKPVQASSESVLLRDFLHKWRRLGSEALSVTVFSTWYGLHLLRLYFQRATFVWTTLTVIAFGIWIESFFNSINWMRGGIARVDLRGGVVEIWRIYEVGKPISDEQSKRNIRAWLEKDPGFAERLSSPARPWEFSFFSDIPGGSVIEWKTPAPDVLGMVIPKPVLIRPYQSWRLRFPFGILPAFLLVWTIRVYLRRNAGSVAARQSA